MVLWTRLTGADLPERVPVRWEVAATSASATSSRAATRSAEADVGAQRARRAGRARAGALVLVPLQRARPAERGRPHAHRAGRRRARRRCASRSPAASATTLGHYAAWRHVAGENLDLVLFLGDYIYEYGAAPDAGAPRTKAARSRTLRAVPRPLRARTRATRPLQAAHAAAPWLLVWDDHEVDERLRRPAAAQTSQADFARAPRRRLPGLLGAHAVSEVGAPARRRHAHLRPARLGRAGAHPRCSTTASTATSRPARSPGRGGSNTVRARATARRCSTRSARCSAPSRSAGSPTAGTSTRPLEPARASRR